MRSYKPLTRVTKVFGNPVATLEDAAYLVRQQVIEKFDLEGLRLVRELRSASSSEEAYDAERHLASWLSRQDDRRSVVRSTTEAFVAAPALCVRTMRVIQMVHRQASADT
jgi:hypothetical protein